MSKPIIYYTLYGTRYSERIRIVGVTSETKYGRINGRYVDNDAPAHWRRGDLMGRVPTLADAEAKIDRVKKIRSEANRLTKPLKDEWCKIEQKMMTDIERECASMMETK